MRRLAAAAALCALAACAPRPPEGVRRLDRGSPNRDFSLDRRAGRLLYTNGGGDLKTKRVTADLETGRVLSEERVAPAAFASARPPLFKTFPTSRGLLTLETGPEGATLRLVDPHSDRALAAVPWPAGGFLDVDGERGLIYFILETPSESSLWLVPLDPERLPAAGRYLLENRPIGITEVGPAPKTLLRLALAACALFLAAFWWRALKG